MKPGSTVQVSTLDGSRVDITLPADVKAGEVLKFSVAKAKEAMEKAALAKEKVAAEKAAALAAEKEAQKDAAEKALRAAMPGWFANAEPEKLRAAIAKARANGVDEALVAG